MGHVSDRWTVPGPTGRRVKGPRYGMGKRWLARWSEPDGRERSKACSSKDEAQAHLAKVDVDVRTGTYVRDTNTTFEAYARTWLAHQLHHRESTAKQAESRLRLHAFPAFGGTPIGLVKRSDVQAMIAGCGLGPAATKVLYAYTSAVFRSAVEDRVIGSSPCVRIALPEVARARVAPLPVETVRLIGKAMLPSLQAMLWTGVGTGMRPGELRGLTVDRLTLPKVGAGSVRVDRQLATVRAGGVPVWGPPKTPAGDRSIPVGESVVAALRDHLARFPAGAHQLVFTTVRGTPLSRSSLQYAWEAATAGLGLPPRSGWHELRHHHASLLIAAGLSPRAVADRLGHDDPSETMRTYAHLWASDEARAVAALEAIYGSADGPQTDHGWHRRRSEA